MINPSEVFGLTEQHLNKVESQMYLHQDALAPFLQLKQTALSDDIDLAIASSFRDFERQLLIWDQKFSGVRPVYSKTGELINMNRLSEWQKVEAILAFSALPGASRHHWGTDIDVFDKNAVDAEYKIQLSPDEYQQGGPFYKLSKWLINNVKSHQFFLPYLSENAGIAQELWHISYYPKAVEYQQYLQKNPDSLLQLLQKNDIAGISVISEHFDKILDDYIFNISEV